MDCDRKFIDQYYTGEADVHEIDNYLLRLGESSSEMYDLLGLTEQEFQLFSNARYDELDESLKLRKRQHIIEKAKTFFRDTIAVNHMKNAEKLVSLDQFQLNPFLDKYKANFLTGNNSPESVARALIYPRILGTSLNTTFGTSMQHFCSSVLEGFSSTTTGMDIEFVDFMDGRKKYCQIKAGPNTINKDDVVTIINHFQSVKNLARTNNLDIRITDLIVGVFYGTNAELSTHYQKIDKTHPVYVGEEFWYRLTGEQSFYQELSDALGTVASEYDCSERLEEIVQELANDIRNKIL